MALYGKNVGVRSLGGVTPSIDGQVMESVESVGSPTYYRVWGRREDNTTGENVINGVPHQYEESELEGTE